MEIRKEAKYVNRYSLGTATEGELMAMWTAFEAQRLGPGLGPVAYDVWLQLNRAMEGIAPQMVKIIR